MATSNDPAELFRRLARLAPYLAAYAEGFPQGFVELSNKGRAREARVQVTRGAMWRSKYDMPPDDFAKEVDRLWEQVKPLYVSLHSYVRWKAAREIWAMWLPASGPISGAPAGQYLGTRLV